MLSFVLFAAGYLARPLGGWLFGRIADQNGRRKPLLWSSALMGVATIGICLIPNYTQIGLLSTSFLLALRICQGLALGGEVNTSAMYLIEHSSKKTMIAGSLSAAIGALGMFVGGMLAALIQSITISWLWRVIFACVGFFSLAVCYCRKQLAESPEFSKQQLPAVLGFWQSHWRGLCNIAAAGSFVSVTIYLCNVFWLSFAIDHKLWSNLQCLWIASFAQCASAFLALPIAMIAKPEHASGLLRLSMLLSILVAPTLFYFTEQQMVHAVLFALAGYVCTNGLLCASLYYFLYQQLPPYYRCRGVSTTWAIAATLGAVCLPIAQHGILSGFYWLPGFLVAVNSLLCFLIINFCRTNDRSILVRFP